jgi:hypothetical protein
MPTYFLTVFHMPKWGFYKIDWFRQSFLWRGQDLENVKGALFSQLAYLHEAEKVRRPWHQRLGQIQSCSQDEVALAPLRPRGKAMKTPPKNDRCSGQAAIFQPYGDQCWQQQEYSVLGGEMVGQVITEGVNS